MKYKPLNLTNIKPKFMSNSAFVKKCFLTSSRSILACPKTSEIFSYKMPSKTELKLLVLLHPKSVVFGHVTTVFWYAKKL